MQPQDLGLYQKKKRKTEKKKKVWNSDTKAIKTTSEQDILKSITSSTEFKDFFYIFPLHSEAFCKICNEGYSYDTKLTGNSTLNRHIERVHPVVYNAVNKGKIEPMLKQKTLHDLEKGSVDKSMVSDLPIATRYALAVSCSKHVIPLSFFQDEVISICLGTQHVSGDVIKNEIKDMSNTIKANMFTGKKHEYCSLAVDGWKNATSKEKHLSITMFYCNNPQKPIFIKSHVIANKKAETIAGCILETIAMLKENDIKVIAVVADNERTMTASKKLIEKEHKDVAVIGCAAHIFNLMIKDCFANVPFLKQALKTLECYINDEKVKRYVPTRWNSAFQRLSELEQYLTVKDPGNDEITNIRSALSALEPIISCLNIAQADGTNWKVVIDNLNRAIDKLTKSGYDGVLQVVNNRKGMLYNKVVNFILYTDKDSNVELTHQEKMELLEWADALGLKSFRDFWARKVMG